MFNVYGKTVTESSANIGVGEFYIAKNKDHMNICKPLNKNCFIYQKILKLIEDLIKLENLNCEKCKLKLNLINEKNGYYFFQYFNGLSNF